MRYLAFANKADKENFHNIARVEKSHYFMIKSEIELLEKFPDYYNVQSFHWA